MKFLRNITKEIKVMLLSEIKTVLGADFLGEDETLLEKDIKTAFGSDLMSDVLAFVDEQAMLDKVDGYNKNVDGSDSDLEDSFVNTLAYISDWGKSWSTAVNTSIQNADGTLKTGDSVIDTEHPENTYLNWKDGSIDALIEISIQVNEDYEYVSSEILNEMTFVNKDYWLNQQGSNINYDPAAGTTTTQKSGGLSTPVLIAIIAGGVVVLAAVVVVVIVVSKKKKADSTLRPS